MPLSSQVAEQQSAGPLHALPSGEQPQAPPLHDPLQQSIVTEQVEPSGWHWGTVQTPA